MALFTPPINPDYDSGSEKRFLVKPVEFGDGYALRAQDGIKDSLEDYSLSWTNLSLSQYQTIRNYLDSFSGGKSFQWVTFDEVTLNFYILGYTKTVTRGNPNTYSITVTFKECSDA